MGEREKEVMAKFCGNCGVVLDEGAKICGFCGTPVESEGRPQRFLPNKGVRNSSSEKQLKAAKGRKIIKKIIICAIIIAVLVAAGFVAYSLTGYRGVVHKTMWAYKNYDIDTLKSFSSSLYNADMAADQFSTNIKEPISYGFDVFDSELGYDYKITYKVTDAYKLSKRQLAQMIESLNDVYAVNVTDVISEIEIVTVDITATNKLDWVNTSRELYFSKEENGWRLLGIE